MSGDQCRMGRAALNLSIPQLADLAGVSKGTIERLEAGEQLKAATFAKVQAAFEKAGLEFTPHNGCGEGVRFAKPPKKRKPKAGK